MKWPQRNHKTFSLKGGNMSPYIKELPGRFGVARLPAAVFDSLVSHNEVVPLAADLLDRKHESFGGQLFLDALEQLWTLPSLVQTPAAPDSLDKTQNNLGGEVGAGGKCLLRVSWDHGWSWKTSQSRETFHIRGLNHDHSITFCRRNEAVS